MRGWSPALFFAPRIAIPENKGINGYHFVQNPGLCVSNNPQSLWSSLLFGLFFDMNLRCLYKNNAIYIFCVVYVLGIGIHCAGAGILFSCAVVAAVVVNSGVCKQYVNNTVC